jgi:hypothetical protein
MFDSLRTGGRDREIRPPPVFRALQIGLVRPAALTPPA